MRNTLTLAVISVVLSFSATNGRADTLTLQTGDRVKGLILKEFTDRVVISTPAGERYFMKQEIRSASYSDDIRALLQKARNAVKKGEYKAAHDMYSEVMEKDPDNEEAYLRLEFLERYIKKWPRRAIFNRITSRNPSFRGVEDNPPFNRVKDYYLSILRQSGKNVTVKGVMEDTRGLHGVDLLRKGDRIVSLWGEPAAYMKVDEVAGFLAKNRENRIRIERRVKVKLNDTRKGILPVFVSYKDVTGSVMKLTNKGIEVAMVDPYGPFDNADIVPGDIICGMDGEDTRYIPYKNFIRRISRRQGSQVDLSVLRDITIWSEN